MFMMNTLFISLAFFLIPCSFGDKNVSSRIIVYNENSTTLRGYLAYDNDLVNIKRPAVIIVHDWNGRDEFENSKAEDMARLGYVGFAVDLFGSVGSENATENLRLIEPFLKSKELWLRRLQLSLDEVLKLEFVDKSKIAAFGYCFGGRSVLEMARNGMDIDGVASFHGSLNTFEPMNNSEPINAKILVLHGHEDKGISPQNVRDFQEEMTIRNADWQVHVYGKHTLHGFAVPKANRPPMAQYNPIADKRSWISLKNFLQEIFASE